MYFLFITSKFVNLSTRNSIRNISLCQSVATINFSSVNTIANNKNCFLFKENI